MKLYKTNFFIFAVVFAALGGISLAIEYTFYQYIDSKNHLQETILLPLGALLLILASISFVASVISYFFKRSRIT